MNLDLDSLEAELRYWGNMYLTKEEGLELIRLARQNRGLREEIHDAENVLAESLGFDRLELGEPGTSGGRVVEYNTGDHTVTTLAMEAAHRLPKRATDMSAFFIGAREAHGTLIARRIDFEQAIKRFNNALVVTLDFRKAALRWKKSQ